MTLRLRLALGIFLIALAFAFPLLVALRSLQQVHIVTEQLRNADFGASLLVGRLRVGMDDLRRAEDALLFVHDAGSRDRMSREVATLTARSDSLAAYALDSMGRHVRDAASDVAAAAPHEYTAALAGNIARAESISTTDVRPAIARAERWTGAAEQTLRERTRRRVEVAAATTEAARRGAVGSLAIATLLGGLIGIGLIRSISRPVRDLERGMKAVADGQFGYRLSINPARLDEFGTLAASYQSMAAQLAELDKLKAEFVSVASHELKTPLNVIVGYIQLLDEGVYGPLTPRQSEVCRTLEAQCQSVNRLIKQLLDVSRFEAGGGKLEPRPMSLGHFLEELQGAFHVLALQRGVAFRVERANELPHEVVWDPDRMNEVLGNLLSNAFKFTPRRGRVELIAEAIDETIHMEVRDSGAGIDPDQLPHIFEKFYKADNQAAANAEGTGLGLAIAREIVEAHGGRIAVHSEPGTGTTFFIELPVHAIGWRRGVVPPRGALSHSEQVAV